MSAFDWIWKGAKLVASNGLKLIGVKPVAKWPTNDGPEHEYPHPDMEEMLTWYQYRRCLKCRKYNPDRALITRPPCSEKLPKVETGELA